MRLMERSKEDGLGCFGRSIGRKAQNLIFGLKMEDGIYFIPLLFVTKSVIKFC